MNKVLAAVVLAGSFGLVHAEQSERAVKSVVEKTNALLLDIAERVNPVVRESMLNFLASCTPEEKELFDQMMACAMFASANGGKQSVACERLQQACIKANNEFMEAPEIKARLAALGEAYAETADAVIAEMPEQTARMARETRAVIRAITAAAEDARLHKVS